MKSRTRKNKRKSGGTMWSTAVPYDTQFHGDLPKNKLKQHVDDIEKVIIPNLQDDIQVEIDKNKIQLAKNNERRAKIEEAHLRNSAIYNQTSAKWYMFLLAGLVSFFKYIFAGIGSLLYILIFVVLGQVLLLIFSAVKVIVSNPVIVGAIFLVISIILILQFVFGYLVPLPGFVSKKPPEKTLEGQKLAESKIEYEYDFIKSMQEFFLSIPQWFDNALVNMKLLWQKLSKFFGNSNILDLYIKDREEEYAGRWDNIINMELGKLVNNFENVTPQDTEYIYSIIKPKPLTLNLADLKSAENIQLDVKKLPKQLYENIEQSQDILKFSWDMQNINDGESVQYVMSCNSYDKNGNVFKLYANNLENEKECVPIKIPFKNESMEGSTLKYYDKMVVRGDKSLNKDEYIQIT